MSKTPHAFAIALLGLGLLGALAFGPGRTAVEAGVETQDRIVLANPDRHVATYRVGTTQRDVQPGKAGLLKPKRYPLALEYWSGSTTTGWARLSVPEPGLYEFRLQSGVWSLSPRRPRAGAPPVMVQTWRTRGARHTLYRSTGARARVVTETRYPVRRDRVRYRSGAPLERSLWALAVIYRVVRDARDREFLRDIIVGREIDEAIRRKLEGRLVALPLKERELLAEAFGELETLSDRDLQAIDRVRWEDLERARAAVGDIIPEEDWEAIGDDWVQATPLPAGGDIDTMDENVDLGDLDVPAIGDTYDEIDIGDVLPGRPQGGGGPPLVDLPDLGVEVNPPDVDDIGDYGGAGDFGWDPPDAGGLDDLGAGDDFGGILD